MALIDPFKIRPPTLPLYKMRTSEGMFDKLVSYLAANVVQTVAHSQTWKSDLLDSAAQMLSVYKEDWSHTHKYSVSLRVTYEAFRALGLKSNIEVMAYFAKVVRSACPLIEEQIKKNWRLSVNNRDVYFSRLEYATLDVNRYDNNGIALATDLKLDFGLKVWMTVHPNTPAQPPGKLSEQEFEDQLKAFEQGL